MRINMLMVMIGLFLIGMGIGTMELDSNKYSLWIGISLSIKGLSLLFFSIEEHRNPVWLKRQIRYLIWKYLPIGQ